MIRENGAVVLPRELRVHAVDMAKFTEFKDSISGLTAENIPTVQRKIIELGLSVGPPAEA